ncbi:MAG: hypothetical protein D9C04_04355 [Nitrosopumilus sp. B06]|nr:MAG: hypothetical protein D9C04_04355 [Nitrosopumilus sp. B06]
MNYSLYVALFTVATIGFLVPAHAQLADHVVINEVEINPSGDDAESISEWVELYNPTDSPVDLKGWQISSTGFKKTLEIPVKTILHPGQTVIFSYTKLWFVDIGDSVKLRSGDGTIIDETPNLIDKKNDFKSWQRLYDGYAPNSINDWKFATASADSSNGKLIESQEVIPLSMSVSVEKSSYLFGETAIIKGNVSERIFAALPTFQSSPVVISITGPSFENEYTLYPDSKLNFETSLNLQKVLGIGKGNYDVSATYSDVTASTSFTVGDKILKPKVVEDTVVTIMTDKPSYMPGQTMSVTATTNKIIPSKVLQFEIVDPNGKIVRNGNLFSTDGKFSTLVFLTTVNPAYGTYEIKATFAEKSATTTFEVLKEAKDNESDPVISLAANQTAYGIGDTVSITGKISHARAEALDLSINQVKVASADKYRGLSVDSIINVDVDGYFAYTFDVQNDKNGLGDYLFRVSGSIGTAEILISVVEDPVNFVRSTEPLTIMLNSESFEIGQTSTISGHVLNPILDHRTGVVTPISITISNAGGKPLQITALNSRGDGNIKTNTDYVITTIPKLTGSYATDLKIDRSIFDAGSYILTAKHSGHTAKIMFEVYDSLDLSKELISIDKNIYGLGETITLTGILPGTTAGSIDIKLTKPDGTTASFTAPIKNQRTAWTWDVPDTKQSFSATAVSAGDSKSSNLGLYEILVSFDSKNIPLNFKVSLDPENDSLDVQSLTISADKMVYDVGEKMLITGSIGQAKLSLKTSAIPVTLYIYQISPYDPISVLTTNVIPKTDGSFSSIFDLPVTLFADGSYRVRAIYQGDKVVTGFIFGSKADVFSISTDNTEYLPGSAVTVSVSGKSDSKGFEISMIQETGSDSICGMSICGSILGTKKLVQTAVPFEHTLDLPESAPFGKYEVIVGSGSLVKAATFYVVEELAIVETAKPITIIEKENRITDKEIAITIGKKTTDNGTISPRVLSGSMIVNRGDEADVNLMVSTDAGTCVIGPGDGCLVSESTRKPGEIYNVVEADGMSLKVRYSGPDVRLEKFSILPESADEFLPEMDWKVDIVKDEQISRFYYKVTYKTIP